MQLSFGGVSYAVHFADADGNLGEIDHTRGTITIDPDKSSQHVMQTLAHEAAHAVVLHTPPPSNCYSEQYADWLGAAFLDFYRQLVRQGGEAAVMAAYAQAGGKIRDQGHGAKGIGDSEGQGIQDVDLSPRQCSRCRQSIAGGSVVRQPAMHRGLPVVRETFYCESCDELEVTLMMATATGAAAPVMVGQPRRIADGGKIRKWLEAHPLQADGCVWLD